MMTFTMLELADHTCLERLSRPIEINSAETGKAL